jgi:cytochrome c nitrite reductase small subunit
MLGASIFTFGYARGYSYLTNDPAACANCHIMSEHFDAWMKSSHRQVATCNDCHTPHDVVGKYMTKARNGFWHSYYFTLGNYPDPLRATPRSRQIAEDACRYCHVDIVEAIDPAPSAAHPVDSTGRAAESPMRQIHRTDSCIRCHSQVGHHIR